MTLVRATKALLAAAAAAEIRRADARAAAQAEAAVAAQAAASAAAATHSAAFAAVKAAEAAEAASGVGDGGAVAKRAALARGCGLPAAGQVNLSQPPCILLQALELDSFMTRSELAESTDSFTVAGART